MGLEYEDDSRNLVSMAAALSDAANVENIMGRIKNLAYTIPTVGRIAIGEMVEQNGETVPMRLNRFIITGQHQRNGRFVEHPIQAAVATATNQEPAKLHYIPIKLMFNDVDLNVRQRYEAYGPDARMLCAGDGETGRRKCAGKIEQVDCPGADNCEYGKMAQCKLMTRLNVQIDVPGSKSITPDPLTSFSLRSAGINTAKTLRAKLEGLHAMFKGNLTGLPLELRLRQKSSTLSAQSIFYYVDLVLSTDIPTAARLAKGHADAMEALGLDIAAYEEAARSGMANGPFEDSSEDFLEALEYLPEHEARSQQPKADATNPAQLAGSVVGEGDPLAWMGLVREQLGQLESLPH